MPRGVYNRKSETAGAAPASVKETFITRFDKTPVIPGQIGRPFPSAFLGGIKINVNIPPDATLAQVEQTLEIGIDRYRDLTEAREQIMPILGRILYEVRERKLFRPGHKNFTGWLRSFSQRVKMAPSTLFDTLKVVRSSPSLSTEEYQRYGAARLLLVSRVADETKPEYKELLAESLTMTVDDFRERVQEIRAKGQDARPKPHIIAVRASQQSWDRWQELVKANPNVTIAELFASVIDHFYETAQAEPKPATPETKVRRRA